MKIETRGMKGHDIYVDIGPQMLISAPNGAGKSTVADAIRFAALGYVPALGKRPMDTAALMRDSEMSVTLTLDADRVIERSLRRRGEGFVGQVRCSWIDSRAKNAEHAAAALRQFGRDELDVAECLDVRQLLAATPQQRAARIEAMLESSRTSATERPAQIARWTVGRLAQVAEDRIPDDYRDIIRVLPAAVVAALRAQNDMLAAKVGEGVAAAIAWANDEKNRAARGIAGKTAARAEIETRLAGMHPVAALEVLELEAERGQLERDLGGLQERALARAMYAETRRRLEGQAANAEKSLREMLPPPRPAGGDTAEIDAQIRAHQETSPPPPDETEIEALRAEAHEMEIRRDGMRPAAIPDQTAIRRNMDAIRARIAAAESSPWREVEEIGLELAHGESSEYERNIGMRLTAIARAQMECDVEQEQANFAAEGLRLTAMLEEAQRIGAANREIEVEKAMLAERIAGLRGQAKRIEDWGLGEFGRAQTAWRRTLIDMQMHRDRLQREIDTAAQAGSAFAARRALLEKSIAEARAKLETLPAPPAADETDDEAIGNRLAAIQAILRAASAAAAVRVELEGIVAEIASLEAERDVFAAMEWALQRAREAEIRDAGGPLVERMASFIAGANRSARPYIRVDKGACEIGWLRYDGSEVPIQALSGGEYVLFATALTSAVIELRAAPVRVLLVEAGECDAQALIDLMDGIETVKDLTTAIVMTQQAIDVMTQQAIEESSGGSWKIVNL